MDFPHSTIDEPATAEYVLTVLQDEHRQWCEFDPECEPSISLSMKSTIQEWRAACDLVGWRQLSRALNESWNVEIPLSKWKAVLEPSRQRSLMGVCPLIARHAKRQRIQPVIVFGRKCRPAAAFMAVRHLLGAAGANASEIAPSSPLAPYTRQYAGTFLGEISRLAPGALPPVRIHTPAYNASLLGLVAGLSTAVLGLWSGYFIGTYIIGYLGVSILVLSYLAIHVVAQFKPASVAFGELQTFGDLARVIAAADSKV